MESDIKELIEGLLSMAGWLVWSRQGTVTFPPCIASYTVHYTGGHVGHYYQKLKSCICRSLELTSQMQDLKPSVTIVLHQ